MKDREPSLLRLEIPGLPRDEWDRELEKILADLGEPAYRSRQIERWTFQRNPESFEAMSDLPRELRRKLGESAVLHPLRLVEERLSRDGTRKYLWERSSGNGAIESVLIPETQVPVFPSRSERGRIRKRSRITYCISTQAGCPVKCTFCATGYGGFAGQLGAAEIVDQVLQVRRISRMPPTNIVYMGMGEPLLNLQNTFRSILVLGDPRRLGLGARRITVSTVGVPKGIVELGERFPQVKLAVSLHAARDDLRSELIPLNRKHPLSEVLAALREHHRITGKPATIEYVVLPGVNGSERDARDLARLLEGLPSRINLIEFNPFPGVSYRKPEVRVLMAFREMIARSFPGSIMIRRSRGADIHGACGQLTLASGRP